MSDSQFSRRWLALWPIALGLLVLFVPTFRELATTVWESEDQGHGPIILAVVAYLFWRERDAIRWDASTPATVWGAFATLFGLVMYVVGRSQSILQFEVGSLLPILAGSMLLTGGWRVIRTLLFPLLFLVFIVPLPGVFVDAITGVLKQHISVIAENLLYSVGYPIARQGVILTIGPYQLLVADACSGLHSIFSLSAIGILYVYLMRHANRLRNVILIASLVPLAIVANIIRVIVLVLVTYHLGDEAGQGFLHGAAGMLLFVVALGLLFALDGALGRILGNRTLPSDGGA